MKVCIIGDFSNNLDEGLKNIACNIYTSLKNDDECDLLKMNVNDILHIKQLNKIKSFNPDIIHYIPGPTNKSFLFLKLLKIYLKKKPKFIQSFSYPMYNEGFFKIVRFKPDYVITSSYIISEKLNNYRIKNHILPNGVDINRFHPIPFKKKMYLREKYNLELKKFTILHVGHIKKNRNLNVFMNIPNTFQKIIVASNYITLNENLKTRLEKSGCKLFIGYNENVQEMYQLSDCYLFPVNPDNSIMCPLSILEAMSCNIPVITKKFYGIFEFFQEDEGLKYISDDDEIIPSIEKFNLEKNYFDNRKKIIKYSWNENVDKIKTIYNEVLIK